MRIGSTGSVIYLRVKVEKSRVKRVWICICILVGWLVLGPSYFSSDVLLHVFFTGIVCSITSKK